MEKESGFPQIGCAQSNEKFNPLIILAFDIELSVSESK